MRWRRAPVFSPQQEGIDIASAEQGAAPSCQEDEKPAPRWSRARSSAGSSGYADDGSLSAAACQDDGAVAGQGFPPHAPPHGGEEDEDELLRLALRASLGLADASSDLLCAAEACASEEDDLALLRALEELEAEDLAAAKAGWAEASKVRDTSPTPRSKLQAAAPTMDTPQETPTAGATSSGSGRNLRRAKRRAEKRGKVWGAQAAEPDAGGCVVLVREDCRLHDNPALLCAAEEYAWVVPVYIHDDEDPSPWPVRGAGLWWRHCSLRHFEGSLQKLGGQLVYRRGSYVAEAVNLLLEVQACALLFNRQLEPWHHQRDLELQRVVGDSLGMEVRSFSGMCLAFEPWEVRDRKKANVQVKQCVATVAGKLHAPPVGWPRSLALDELGFGRTAGRRIPPGFRQFNEARQAALEGFPLEGKLKKDGAYDPKVDDWAYEMARFWKMGEEAAMARLDEWIADAAWGCYYPPGLNPRDSAGGRFRADRKWTAILSPYLRFGDLSPRYVYWRCREMLPHELSRLFIKRIYLRDKAYSQLYKWPDSHTKSIRPQYDQQHWSGTRLQLRRWQRGETGFPLVDAAMRQLWKVGWICNHLRHVTAQFLIEHLDLSWKDGFAWYDYTLVDTDVAINAMMWQMGGHSGVGSWNFVMHPIFAGKKVDPEGAYVRRWLPELRGLPVEYIHTPWEAPMHSQLAASVLVNDVYWQRIIQDLVAARLAHQRNVIALRKRFPEFVKDDGTEIVVLETGEVFNVSVRDDIRENDNDKITLMMTADDPRSNQRRKLVSKNGVHTSLIFEESKRFEAMYDF
eukprot:gb/GFBE01052837.1/.p1 GENE.gb/GFBE01052837.1/~~gb/GFBE01052837.1/.p1  ORF type:complete len:799 (+),score=165.92 gb/GFBE01052837.1/:1-2397(+)